MNAFKHFAIRKTQGLQNVFASHKSPKAVSLKKNQKVLAQVRFCIGLPILMQLKKLQSNDLGKYLQLFLVEVIPWVVFPKNWSRWSHVKNTAKTCLCCPDDRWCYLLMTTDAKSELEEMKCRWKTRKSNLVSTRAVRMNNKFLFIIFSRAKAEDEKFDVTCI